MEEFGPKVIRDAIHGDILIPERYVKVIDTPEFQRLRRIKQLSVGNLAFPGAEHTRFSHSIGTFCVMGRIIEHFDYIFQKIKLPKITDQDKEVALLAALLHDIGHGPFSHAFEGVLASQNCPINHEKMSIRIITDASSVVHNVLCKEFGDNYPELVATMIDNKRKIKQNGFNRTTSKLDLEFVLSSLISSQLDADRMDYLLRDAMYSGVKCGNIDLSRIISAMTINVNDKNEFCVCVKSKYISDIENYLSGRYQMNKSVYYHSLKCQMELIIMKILKRARYLYSTNKLIGNIPKPIICIFKSEELSVSDYTSLDDNTLYYLISIWKECDDIELSFLCKALLNRNKFRKIPIMHVENKDYISAFKLELSEIFAKYDCNVNLEDISFYLENEDKFNMYKNNKEKDIIIYVLDQFGILSDISNESQMIKTSIKENKSTIFISFELLEKLYGSKKEMIDEIKKLTQKYDSRNHIEIEKKYFVKEDSAKENVLDVVKSFMEYSIDEGTKKLQTDYYYDTNDYILEKNDITLRIRKKANEKYILTIKKPAVQDLNAGKALRNERFEHEYFVDSDDIRLCQKYINNHIEGLIEIENLIKSLVINNNRTKYEICDSITKKELFEMVFDDVQYENPNNGRASIDKQIEIELKAEYDYTTKLKILTDRINHEVQGLEEDTISKYRRGLLLTNIE